MNRLPLALLGVGLSVLIAGCGVTAKTSSPLVSGTGPLVFRAAPLDVSAIRYIIPLGNLNPPDHTFPTDHIYFYYTEGTASKDFTVYAPATGEVYSIIKPDNTDHKIFVKVNDRYSYYLDHVYAKSGIGEGTLLQAGDIVGTTSDQSAALDLGAVDAETTLSGFINPKRYHDQTLHTVSPLAYYSETLKTTLYAKVRRDGSDKDGKIDFDQSGKLVGNWFLEGLPEDPTGSNGSRSVWMKQIAFVYDVSKPTEVRIAIGGELSQTGMFEVAPTDPDPASVNQSSGIVIYSLWGQYTTEFARDALLLVQLIADDKIKVETFAGDSTTAAFTTAAKTYTR